MLLCLTEFLSAPYVQEKEEKREAKKVIEALADQRGHTALSQRVGIKTFSQNMEGYPTSQGLKQPLLLFHALN